jgi:hypothetical protein
MMVFGGKRETGGQVLNGVCKEVLHVRNAIPQGRSRYLAKKKVVREGNDILVVIRSIIIVRATGECIGTIGRTSNMFEVEIEFEEVVDVMCDVSWNFLWMAIICEVGVVHEDLNRDMCASKEMFPMIETEDKAHEFSVPDIVIAFCLCEFSGCRANH